MLKFAAALKFICAGATVFDIGANKGEWARAIRERGDVRLFLFEPEATCAPYLAIDGAILTQAAVGEVDGGTVLYSPGDAVGNASPDVRGDTYFAGQTFEPSQVAVISINSFAEGHAIPTVDFMKMDIEGHELFALKGAERAPARGGIRALSFEFGSGNINSRTFFRDYSDLLTKHNYEIYRILPRGGLCGFSDTMRVWSTSGESRITLRCWRGRRSGDLNFLCATCDIR